MRKLFLLIPVLFISLFSICQEDSTGVEAVRRMVNLSEVVIRSDLNVASFLRRIKNDTTFYKAFKNLRVLGFTSLNDIRMMDKKGQLSASLQSKTKQVRKDGCRSMEVLEEKTSGNFYNRDQEFNYYTAELYAGLFFTKGKVCGETNIVGGAERSVRNKKGTERHKEQLKMLFFNPGKKVPGIPFIGDKLDVFDEDVVQYYDYTIDMNDWNGASCYVFTIKAKPGLKGAQKDKIVFDEITTWFHTKTMEIVVRQYSLSYNAAVYDFDVRMEVEMMKFGNYLVPQTLRYKGNWDVAFKKRERGIFTATLSNFENHD
jgi:hypothetical protein